MTEEWRDIPGYENLYQASNLGRIRSVERYIERADGYKNHIMPRVLKQKKNNSNNYLLVNLHKDKKPKRYLVHRLIAITFIPNPHNLPQVNHKDENPQNNKVSNLEWCDCKYNICYGTARRRHSEHVKNRPDISKPVEQYTRDGVYIATYPSSVEAHRQTGVWHQSIWRVMNGILKTAGGFIWKYAQTGQK